ncbi:ABC transporter permease [Bacteroidota bacterium]
MFRNYFKTAYRILTRNKVFSIINIFGLSIALTSVLIIFLFITNEFSFDKHHSKFDRIYRIVTKQIQNDNESYDETVPVPLGTALKVELTGHDHITQIYFDDERLLRVGDNKYLQSGLLFADTNFVKVFDVDFIKGNPDELRNPNTIFLTEELAVKYFGSISEAINKEIVMLDSISFNVAGVVKNPPKNTHIPYKLLISWISLSTDYFNFTYDNWGTHISGFGTYLTLKEGISEEAVTKNILKIVANNIPDENDSGSESYILQRLGKIHFDDRFHSFSGAYITSQRFILIFISVGLFILLIAFINFTNLSIVQTIKRAKEVGIRKVLGADRFKLIKQFLGETFLILLIAEIISIILTEVVLGKINSILGNSMELHLYGKFSIIIFLLIVLISLTFLSGIYPATVLSKYNPIRALRYNMKLGKRKSFSLYNLLIILQFFISQVLIVSAIVISLQIDFFKNKDMGFQKDNVIMVNLPGYQSSKVSAMLDLLKQNPDIEKVSLGIGAPLAGSNITSSFYYLEDEETNYHANVKTVDTSYYRLYNLKIIAGEWYKTANINDSTFNIVVTKSLLKKIGVEKPIDAIDKYVRVFGSINARISGVVEDFHAYTLHREIPPVIFLPLEDFYTQIHIRTNGKSYSELKSFIEDSWNEIYPEYIYTYEILEETIENRYKTEQRTSQIIKIFTLVAIIIACLGLYGLVSFMLVQRTKEVGIRKAMGASVSSLVILVSKQFLRLVIISCIIAWPVAYYLMSNWLKNYAYKIELGIGIFILSGIILVLITFLTILYQSIKVSNTKPAEVLKYE